MRRIVLFAEDYGHEHVLTPIIHRLAELHRVDVELKILSARGGSGRVETEFATYVEALLCFKKGLPDLIVVATDANCLGINERRKRLQKTAEPIRDCVAYAIPDPHVERWLLRDPAAFKAAFRTGCKMPDQKCGRDRYKQALAEAIAATGIAPTIGGLEHAEDIVAHFDLERTSRDDFGMFLQQMQGFLRRWVEDADGT